MSFLAEISVVSSVDCHLYQQIGGNFGNLVSKFEDDTNVGGVVDRITIGSR